jgi:GTP-binding protein LepA
VQVRVIDGELSSGMKVKFVQTGREYEVYKLGVFTPHPTEVATLSSGEVGYFAASVKNIRDVKIGDTVVDASYKGEQEALPGFKEVKPSVFGGLFPVDADDYTALRSALEKLSLNDSSFTFEPESSVALGFGFRCGYLGLLHMEIIRERLEREFDLSLITTAPTVVYRVTLVGGEVIYVENPTKLPESNLFEMIEEPLVEVTIHSPKEFLGVVMKLCEEKRGVQKNLSFHGSERAVLTYELPWNEVVLDFHDKIKSFTRGYASFDYEPKGYQVAKLVKLDIKLNGEAVDALSLIVHDTKAYTKGRELCDKLQELIDRQMFDVAIQAAIGNKIIARTTVKALRKNVTAKCYGGDISRKRKLLEKQKEGKKRMKQVGSVSLSQEAFLAVLKTGE